MLLPVKAFVPNYGLAVARELVKSTLGENYIYVCVFNPNDRYVFVQKCTKMAVFDPVKTVNFEDSGSMWHNVRRRQVARVHRVSF